MANDLGFLTFDDLRGGRNGVDTPLAVPDTQCVEAINVDFYNARLGRRRKGAIVYSPAVTPAFGLFDIYTLIRHQPFGNETNNELWAIDVTMQVARLVNNVWASLATLPDSSFTYTDPTRVHWASFNNKLFLAYGSGTSNGLDRMHVYDPLTNTIRKAGLGTPGQPAFAPASGTGITAIRGHRMAVTTKVGGVVVRRSDVSPIGVHGITNAGGFLLTQGTLPGEGEDPLGDSCGGRSVAFRFDRDWCMVRDCRSPDCNHHLYRHDDPRELPFAGMAVGPSGGSQRAAALSQVPPRR